MRPVVSALAVSLLAACSQSITLEPDAAIVFDPIPDGGYDAGPVVDAAIGIACTTNEECGEGVCLTAAETGFASGYCTAACPTLAECPAGSTCVDFGDGQLLCLDSCDPAAETRECRAFYGCTSGLGLTTPVCLPGCTDDSDCPGGACNPEGGGRCYDPTAAFGDACRGSDECPDGSNCRDEDRGPPGGMCQYFGCDPVANTGCPENGHCAMGGRGGRCVLACETSADCRAGYACVAPVDYPDRLVCTPACTTNADCPDTGVCAPETGECGD